MVALMQPVICAMAACIQSPAALLPRSLPRAAVSACANDEPLEAFSTWLESKGVVSSAVQGGRLPGYGLSLVAGEAGCQPGDTLMAVPQSLHITPSKVKASPIGQAIDGVIPADDDSALLALGLLGEFAQGEAGELWPYLSVLPGADDMVGQPLLWSEDELRTHFAGSHLYETIGAVKGGLLMQWEAIQERVVPNAPDLFPPQVFNLQGYLYAHAIVLTRSLPFGDDLSLIPFLDLANHQKGATNTCSIGVAKGSGEGGEGAKIAPVVSADQMEALGVGEEVTAVLTASAALAPGEQAFIDYGEGGSGRSSWEMLYTYGFVPGASPEEWVAAGGRPLFFEGIDKDDPLGLQKRALLVTLGTGEDAADGTWLDVQPRPDQCVLMAPLLRLAALADDGSEPLAADLAQWKADPKELWNRMQTPISAATEARVAEKVIATCNAALADLPEAEALLPAAADEKTTSADAERARLAARVLLGERAALEACVSVWQKAAAAA